MLNFMAHFPRATVLSSKDSWGIIYQLPCSRLLHVPGSVLYEHSELGCDMRREAEAEAVPQLARDVRPGDQSLRESRGAAPSFPEAGSCSLAEGGACPVCSR